MIRIGLNGFGRIGRALARIVANQSDLTLRAVNGAVEVGVEDDGVGFEISDTGRFTRKGGFGLFSIREAMQRINGRVEIESTAGKGTRTVVTVPLEGEL